MFHGSVAAGDVLHAHKDALRAHLQERYRSWLGVEFEFMLYNVTSTYFEGEAKRNFEGRPRVTTFIQQRTHAFSA